MRSRMMLSLSKRIVEADRAIRREISNRNIFIGHDLLGQTVGIVGLGNVGKRLAELCRGLFRMRVLAYDPYVSADVMKTHGVEKVELDELMREADFVSINCPLTDETRGMIGAAQYALMKPNAYFITTARGNIHDEKALEEALRAKKIAGAGLDVWEKEPPPLDHPLLKFDNVMVSPHTAGVTHEARVNMGRIAAEQMLAALDGKPVARVLNPEVWPRYAARFKETFGMAPEGRSRRRLARGRMTPSIETRASWVVASMSLAILAIAFGGPWIAVVALKTIAAETGGARSIPAFASSLAWFGAGVGGIVMG